MSFFKEIGFMIIKDSEPFELTGVSEKEAQMLSDTGLDVLNALAGHTCRHHPNSHRHIKVLSFDDEVSVNIFVCCSDFAVSLERLFQDYPVKIQTTFLRALDQRTWN